MTASELTGLTDAEVSERVVAGKVNLVPDAPVRTLREIIVANVFTWINLIVGTLFVLVLIAGHPADGLFVGVIVSNSAIGIIQELRARSTLQSLAVLNAPTATVRRNGGEQDVALEAVVLDDLLVIRTGDQVPVDGEVVDGNGLELDESLLTGESDPVDKGIGAEVMSGSFVVAGSGLLRATKVGADSYASSLAEQARRFELAPSGLRADVDRILRWQLLIIPPIAIVLLLRQLGVHDDWQDAVIDMVAAAVAMVPAGLALLISIAFVVGIIELARRKALAKELASVELLARVDTLCLDKTGTITTGEMSFAGVECIGDCDPAWLRAALATLVAAEPDPNATLQAIATGISGDHRSAGDSSSDARSTSQDDGGSGNDSGSGSGNGNGNGDDDGAGTPWTVTAAVPFSSARKWAAVCTDGHGSIYLGAPEMVLGNGDATGTGDDADADADSGTDSSNSSSGTGTGAASTVSELVGEHAARGRRVLVVARADDWGGDRLPAGVTPAGIVVLEDTMRPDAAEIFAYFVAQGVELKVISGDNPRTVAAVAQRAGIPGAERWVDARELPTDDAAGLAEPMADTVVFGRVAPHQKRAMVHALQSRGRTVAMTGDGVNDVLALKDSDAGIAMGSGSSATRAVAQLVLLDNRFATLPVALAQGRRVINNIERVANLFLTKTAYAVMLALLVGVFGTQFPFLPRQQTLLDAFSIGVPGFVLALAPAPYPIRPGLLRRVLSFAIPAGAIIGIVAFIVFVLADRGGATLAEARTATTFTMLGIALVVLVLASRPLVAWKLALAAAMLGLYVATAAIEPLRRYFQLEIPATATLRWQIAAAIVVGGVLVTATRSVADAVERRPRHARSEATDIPG